MNKMIPVEANPQLARDIITGAILNVDRTSYRSFVEQKRRRQSNEIDLQTKLNTLQAQLDELTQKFDLLIKRVQGNS